MIQMGWSDQKSELSSQSENATFNNATKGQRETSNVDLKSRIRRSLSITTGGKSNAVSPIGTNSSREAFESSIEITEASFDAPAVSPTTSNPPQRPKLIQLRKRGNPNRSTTRAAKSSYFHLLENKPASTPTPASTIASTSSQAPAPQLESCELILGKYKSKVENRDPKASKSFEIELEEIPGDFVPWWQDEVQKSLGLGKNPVAISFDDIIAKALHHSKFIQIIATNPKIKETSIFEQAAVFDWQTYWRAKYDDTNDPIGNQLTTGNNDDRFKQTEYYSESGLKKLNRLGGELDLKQRTGFLDNNSRFLIPPNQANARIELNYRHPIMRGRGPVNDSRIILASLSTEVAQHLYAEELQKHLVKVAEGYWGLIRARSEYFQRRKLLEKAEQLLANLEGRIEVDALDRQVYRAKALVANRRAGIARAVTSIRNAESNLKLLVNDPDWTIEAGIEFVPTEKTKLTKLDANLSNSLSTALLHRPDIAQAIREVKSTQVRLGIAQNEVLPKLDLLMGGYVAGLDGDSDFYTAWQNQFEDGRPGYNVGVEFELPIGNRAALARQNQREWEVVKSLEQFKLVVQTALNDVEVATRETQTTYKEMLGRYHAMVATKNESEYLMDRWKTLPEGQDSVTLLLENLINAQDRQTSEEVRFSESQLNYFISVVDLQRAMGTLAKLTSEANQN